uniref:NOT2/NOT3/NOT5 C-terminal domain-containing protein n=1 Tax=Ditylum brightwellii TaxID=49249 RepID=A0A6V2KE74_9STRA
MAAPAPGSSASSATSDGRSGGADFLGLVGTQSSAGVGMFGQPGGGDLLLGGAGGFEGSIANGGYLNESGGAGGTPAPGVNGSNAFNLSDFPSLGGGGGESTGASGNNGLAAALRQQEQLLAQQQMMQQGGSGNAKTTNLYRLAMSAGGAATGANFNIATEEFPALPGAPPPVPGGSGLLSGGEGTQREVSGSSAGSSASTSSFVTAAPTVSRVNSNGSGVGLYGGDMDAGNNPADYNNILGSSSGGIGNISGVQSSNNPASSSLPHQQRTTSSSTAQTGSGAAASSSGSGGTGSTGGSSLSGDYGLLGLLGVIRMSDADRNALALGSDLTALGLNLSSSDQLYSTFASPWSESPTTREPQYQVS